MKQYDDGVNTPSFATESEISARQLVWRTVSPEGTRSLGRAIAPWLRVGDVVVLSGDLGAGKTCLTQGIGAGLGVTQPITSPTFTLANRYRVPSPERRYLHHLDVYRLESAAEALDLDLPDLQDSGITVIEWGELIGSALDGEPITIELRFDDLDEAEASDDGRILSVTLPASVSGDRRADLARRTALWGSRV